MRILKSEGKFEFNYVGRCIRQLIIGLLMLVLTVSIVSDVLKDNTDWLDDVFMCVVFLIFALGVECHYGILKYKIIVDSEGIHEKRFILKNRTIYWSEIASIDIKNVPYNRSNAYYAVFFEKMSEGRKIIIKTVPLEVDKYDKFKTHLYKIVKMYSRNGVTEYDSMFFS